MDVACHSVDGLVEQFIQYCYAQEHAAGTIPPRRSHLKYFSEFCYRQEVSSAEAINNPLLTQFFLEYGQGRAKSTANAARRTLKVFLQWLEVELDIAPKAKPKAIKFTREPDKMPVYIKRELVLAAIAAATNKYDALLIETIWRAGLRLFEAVNITEGDIWRDEIKIMGKGSKERTVYITDDLAARLQGIMTGSPTAHIFRNVQLHGHGEPITLKAARKHIQKIFLSIGVEMRPRDLRDSFAVELLMQGCDIVSIQRMMGHTYVTTTQVYLRLYDNQIKGQYKKYMV